MGQLGRGSDKDGRKSEDGERGIDDMGSGEKGMCSDGRVIGKVWSSEG